MDIVMWFLILGVCLTGLVKGADYFTVYAEKLGLAFGLSSFIIGATIVAIGTSLPELVSSLFAIGAGEATFVADNIIGSNIANALLILGIGAVVGKGLSVKTSLVDIDLPFFFASMALFIYFIWDKVITWQEGIFLLGFFVIFLLYTVTAGKTDDDAKETRGLKRQFNGNVKTRDTKKMLTYALISLISAGVVALTAKYLITSILTLSELLKISSSTLTITVVAFGTSLPEVLTSIAAIRLGNHAMAVGNVFGSNTFNVLLVAGLPSLFTDLPVGDITMLIAVPFLVIATFAAIFSTFDNNVRVWEGVALLFLYVVFIAKITGII